MAGHGHMQADILLLKELWVLYFDLQAVGATVCHTGYRLSIGDLKIHPHSDTISLTNSHPLQKGHTS